MARYSTPATRAYARDKAAIVGAAERVIYGEIHDAYRRVVNHPVAPWVAVAGFVGFIFLTFSLVGTINL